jgi:hypothetical protein
MLDVVLLVCGAGRSGCQTLVKARTVQQQQRRAGPVTGGSLARSAWLGGEAPAQDLTAQAASQPAGHAGRWGHELCLCSKQGCVQNNAYVHHVAALQLHVLMVKAVASNLPVTHVVQCVARIHIIIISTDLVQGQWHIMLSQRLRCLPAELHRENRCTIAHAGSAPPHHILPSRGCTRAAAAYAAAAMQEQHRTQMAGPRA